MFYSFFARGRSRCTIAKRFGENWLERNSVDWAAFQNWLERNSVDWAAFQLRYKSWTRA
ncbi:hypothetical protein T484DRAFT_1869695 [Baffinella frigidus]|nr:hypothetical protein T484DRAFT_1869695 [Cryptophyta sp. CCMP2293]